MITIKAFIYLPFFLVFVTCIDERRILIDEEAEGCLPHLNSRKVAWDYPDYRVEGHVFDALTSGTKLFQGLSTTSNTFMHGSNFFKNEMKGMLTKRGSDVFKFGGKAVFDRLAPALGLFGIAFAIVAQTAFENPQTTALNLLRDSIETGLATMRRETEERFYHMTSYVDNAVQKVQMENLEVDLQELTNYYINCINDEVPDECTRNALRSILAQRTKFTNIEFQPTEYNELKVQRLLLKIEMYRKYVMVFVLAQATAMMAVEDNDARDIIKVKIDDEIANFEKAVTSWLDQIADLENDQETLKQRCKKNLNCEPNGKTCYARVNDFSDKTCKIWTRENVHLEDSDRACNTYAEWFYHRRIGGENLIYLVHVATTEYMQPFKDGLIGPRSFVKKIKAKKNDFSPRFLDSLRDQVG